MASETKLRPLQSNSSSSSSSLDMDQQSEELEKELESYISTLPKSIGLTGEYLHQYKGFWYGWYGPILAGIISAERQFHQLVDRPPTAMLVTYPKSGTTWLKALLFAITTRTQYFNSTHSSSTTHPLMNTSPHDLVPFLEVYSMNNLLNPIPNASILAAHIPYSLLSDTFKKSSFPIIYVYRDPKDVIVSFWHFANKVRSDVGLSPHPLEKVVDLFCKGQTPYGPYWDHLSEYWDASLQMPSRVLFLNYHELSEDPITQVKHLAEFLGCPFSVEEEQQGMVVNIVDLCGFQNLSKLEVNKSSQFVVFEKSNARFENKAFYRKGEVGDYKNYMSQAMMDRVDAIIKEKLKDLKLK